MRKIPLLAIASAVFYMNGALAADEKPEAAPTPPTAQAAPAPAAAKQPDLTKLQAALRGEKPDTINPAAIPGLYEVVIGGQVYYLSEDGHYIVQGDIIDLNSRDNLTENRRGELRDKALAALDEKDMVVFAPTGPVRHTVTVFTDIDCPYCRKMHSQISAYNKEGIKVRYLLFPREGIGSESYNKAVSVWCSSDRQDAFTKAKRGDKIESKTCDNPVRAQFELGQKLGVQGTPTIILESGDVLPGYVPPTQLSELLAKNDKDKKDKGEKTAQP